MRGTRNRGSGSTGVGAGAALALLVAVAATSSGCAGQFKALRPEGQIEALHLLRQAERSLPHETVRVDSGGITGEPVRLAMEQVGDDGPLVVMVHGVLSDRRVWRFVAGDLGVDHRLLLVDLPGAGDSDRPDPEDVGPDGYSATAMARRLLVGLRNRFEQDAWPEDFTLVGHSLGGAIILRMMGDPALRDEFEDVVERVDSVVLFAPLDFAVEKEHHELASIASLGRTKVGLARVTRILKNEVGRSTREGANDPDSVSREDAQRLLDILKHRKSRRPAQAMIRQAVPFDLKTRRPDWEAIEALETDYSNVDVPTLILWGARDETLPASMGYKLQVQLPDSRLRIVEESMHSLPTERPLVSAGYVRSFLENGGMGWSAVNEIDPGSVAYSDETSVRAARRK
jgi:pimeloyl-ACP methyl ester carboxylesterase